MEIRFLSNDTLDMSAVKSLVEADLSIVLPSYLISSRSLSLLRCLVETSLASAPGLLREDLEDR